MNTIRFEDYRFEVRPLSADEGGGYLVSFPDLPGCMSDGETYEEAIANARDAFASWVAAYQEEGREIPTPNSEGKPAKFVLRVPRHLHERVTIAAAADGVSVNTTVVLLIAEGLARREGKVFPDHLSSTAVSTPGVVGFGAVGSALITSLHGVMSVGSFGSEHDIDSFPMLTYSKRKWTSSDMKYLKDLATAAQGSYTSAMDVVPDVPAKRVRHG